MACLACQDAANAFDRALNPQIARQYFMFQEREATLLIDQLRKQPALYEEHLDRAGASLALSTIYGLPTVTDSHDARIVRVDEFTQRFLKAAMPGTYLVEYFTWMSHLPRWMYVSLAWVCFC